MSDADGEYEDGDIAAGSDAVPIAVTVTISETQLREFVLERASYANGGVAKMLDSAIDAHAKAAVAAVAQAQIEAAVARAIEAALAAGIEVGRTEWSAGTRKSVAQLVVERLDAKVRSGSYPNEQTTSVVNAAVAAHVREYLDAEGRAVRAEFNGRLKAALDDAMAKQIAEMVQRMRKETT